MAQNKLTIQHKRSSTAGAVPAAGVLKPGEIGINFADKKIFTEDTGGTVIELGGGSNWTTETNGISRTDRISVGANADPKVAIDLTGTIGQNVLSGETIDASAAQVWTVSTAPFGALIDIVGTIPNSTTLVLFISGGGSVNWLANIKWPGGTAPSVSSGTDVITLVTSDAGTTWYGNAFVLDGQ